MAQGESRDWLIAYDIADKRRLSRLHRYIKKHAVPVQYSLYWYAGSSLQIDRLMRQIEARIDPRADDVRTYPVPRQTSVDTLGPAYLPEGLSVIVARGATVRKLTHGRPGYD